MQRHVSVMLDGESPEIQMDSSGLYHCPFCTYKGPKCMVDNHIKGPKGHPSVIYREFTIIKCGLGCRKTTHFHCCNCATTIIASRKRRREEKKLQDEDVLTKRARVAPTASSSEGSDKTEDQIGKKLGPGNLKDDVFLNDTIEAAAWCKLQSFSDSVCLPMVIGMEGEEQEAACAELRSDDGRDEEEIKSKIEPFLFSFKSKKDFEIFCVENFDRRNLKVFASFE